MTKKETIQVLQSIEDRAVDFPYMTACDWVAIAAAKRHLENSFEVEEVDSFDATVCKVGSTYLKEMDKDAIVNALAQYKDGDKVKVIIKAQKGE